MTLVERIYAVWALGAAWLLGRGEVGMLGGETAQSMPARPGIQ